MKRVTKIAAIALLAGSAVTLTSMAASANGGKGGPGGFGGKMGGMGEFMQMEFTDIDLDKNGQITVDDLKAKAQARFLAADTNGDGALDLSEIKAQAEARMKSRMGEGKGQMQAGKEGKSGWGGKPSPEKRMTWFAEKMIERRDSDNSGTLSQAEVLPDQARLDRMIDRFDTNDDNAISPAEFDQAQKEIWSRMEGRKGWGDKGGKYGKGRDCS